MAVTKPISSRREMLQVFQTRLQNTQSDLLENTELEFGRNMLKTALIESNISPEELMDDEAIQDVFEIDPDLRLLHLYNKDGEGWLFLDVHDSRFWIIYSMEKSDFFNRAIDDFLSGEGAGLDRLWLPTGEVEWVGDLGNYEGVKISFGADEVFPEDFIEDNLQFSDLNIDSSGSSSRRLYDILKDTEDIDDFLALSRIKIRREMEGEFVRESITNEGAFTTRGGTDIDLHVSTVEQIKNRYAKLLEIIEENHIIGAEQRPHGGRAEGSPVVIRFSHEVPDVEQFLSYVVNAQDPFRLWGHTRQIGDQYYKVDGVDMHNGDKIAIEMSPEWMRLYLYNDACGNTALRIFTNIQQYYDPAANLLAQDEGTILSHAPD